MAQPGRTRQTDSYVRGLGGVRPLVPTRLDGPWTSILDVGSLRS